MSLSLARMLTRHLDSLITGPPLFVEEVPNVIVYPLLPVSLADDPPELLTLREAMRCGLRITDTGVVNRLHVDNTFPVPIFAGESDVLLGSTQTRAIQFSCLIPAERRTSLAVNCIEEGQPINYQATFTAMDACPWSYRAAKMGHMHASGEPQQYWLWERIRDYLDRTRTVSTSHDLHAVFDRNATTLNRLPDLFPLHPAQVGVICAIGPCLVMELCGDPEIMEDRYQQVMRGMLVEASTQPDDHVLPHTLVPPFVDDMVAASRDSRLLPDRGLKPGSRALAFARGTVAGGALLDAGRLVHLYAHQSRVGQSQPFSAAMPHLDSAQNQWQETHPELVQRLKSQYNDRSRRYAQFKERMQDWSRQKPPVTPSTGTFNPDCPPIPAVALPPPLSSPLQRFFQRVFEKR